MARPGIVTMGVALSLAAGPLASAAALTGSGPWILTCDMPSADPSVPAPRVFRIAPKVFQEWRSTDKKFGNNLCDSFPCTADRNRLEGAISSTSVVLTVQVDRRTGGATWRTQGASNLARSTGVCTIHPEGSAQPR